MIRVAILALMLFTLPAFAAEILKIKGTSALIDLKGDPAATGDLFYAIRRDGKRAAILKIGKVKGEKAIAKILRGKAGAGMTLELKPAPVAQSAAKRGDSISSTSAPMAMSSSRAYWGALAGFSQDSMSVKVYGDTDNDGQADDLIGTESLSGSGFSLKGLFDYELFKQIWFRGTVGLEGFSASGANRCGVGNTGPCKVDIYYLSFDFLGRYVFSMGKVRPWAGAGIGLLFPASKDTTALQSSSVSTTNVLIVAGGLDWFINPRMYIPISVEYGMLPKSDEVEASWIALRAGLAIPF